MTVTYISDTLFVFVRFASTYRRNSLKLWPAEGEWAICGPCYVTIINYEYKIKNDIRTSHSPKHLAKSLISFSKGTMPAFEEAFSLFKFPIYFINGEDDTKYIKVARDMMKINKKSIQYLVEKANHNINIENNKMYLTTLNNILNQVS